MPQPVIDPWLEPDSFGQPLVDFSTRPEDMIDPDNPNIDIHPGLQPEIVKVEGGVVVPPSEPVVIAPVLEAEPEGPEVIDLEDGGSIILEKEKGQWKASLDPGNGANPEVFWGKNKNQLVTNVLKAKLNATKKIRDLTMKVKLGSTPAPKPNQTVQPTNRALTADEIFEVKTQLESNPDLALQTWFQKTTGLSVQQLVALAQKGANADANLETDAISRQFMAANPDYHVSQANAGALIKWLAKFKLGKNDSDVYELYSAGVWTVEDLEEAFQDLSSDGLLTKAPRRPTPPPSAAVQTIEPPPAPRPDERIVRTETRPRAALGLRTSDVTPVAPPEAPKAPSVEDLDTMSDKEVADTLAAIRRQRVMSRRSQ